MPADGIFHCTTIYVTNGATLSFKPNSLNTPVYLLATGSVVINGTIDVGGSSAYVTKPDGALGGPGGFSGGKPAFGSVPPGYGFGPGGGKPGNNDYNQGGAGGGSYGTQGTSGSLSVDSIDRRWLQLNFTPLATATVGSTMFVFPTPNPRLDITAAAGRTISEGTTSPVYIQLPFNAPTNQTVTVQARNFGTVVPIKVVLTPDNGPISSYNTEIDNQSSNPASVTVPVVVPVNVQVTVHVWTR